MVCAGARDEVNSIDSCQGDSGGPLVQDASSNRWELVGVVSWGIGCASGYPGVYARVFDLMDWVDSQ